MACPSCFKAMPASRRDQDHHTDRCRTMSHHNWTGSRVPCRIAVALRRPVLASNTLVRSGVSRVPNCARWPAPPDHPARYSGPTTHTAPTVPFGARLRTAALHEHDPKDWPPTAGESRLRLLKRSPERADRRCARVFVTVPRLIRLPSTHDHGACTNPARAATFASIQRTCRTTHARPR